jgi:hypothetical protein
LFNDTFGAPPLQHEETPTNAAAAIKELKNNFFMILYVCLFWFLLLRERKDSDFLPIMYIFLT